MERKDVNAILVEEFLELLKEHNLLDDFTNHKIKCSVCSDIINEDNISLIYYDNTYKFCCSKDNCIQKVNQRG
jgi:hypothetical protein